MDSGDLVDLGTLRLGRWAALGPVASRWCFGPYIRPVDRWNLEFATVFVKPEWRWFRSGDRHHPIEAGRSAAAMCLVESPVFEGEGPGDARKRITAELDRLRDQPEHRPRVEAAMSAIEASINARYLSARAGLEQGRTAGCG